MMNYVAQVLTIALYCWSAALFNTKVTSSICAIFIVLATIVDVTAGMSSFLIYLFLDVLMPDKPFDIYIHHVVSFLLTSLGYVFLLSLNSRPLMHTLIEDAIVRLLMMEITTPFLNLAKHLHAEKSAWKYPVYAVLLILWILVRIVGPAITLMELYRLLYYNLGPQFQIIYGAITVLFFMQCVWFAKLVRMAF